MPVLHLGVNDMPYSVKDGITTWDVAQILEEKYHVMQTFADTLGEAAIARSLERSVENAIEKVMMGSNSAGLSMTAEAENEIKAAFDAFITQQDMDGRVAGVPTAASLAGVNHSFAHPYAKGNPARPSFVDTGTYRNVFAAEISE